MATKLQLTMELGVEFWNDSCDLKELAEAVANGAMGATSNPVIVATAVEAARDVWLPVLDALVRDRPRATEDEIAWALTVRMARDASRLQLPAHERTEGRAGFLCVQVDPRLCRDAARMTGQGREIAAIGRNVAVKIPATAAGVSAIEQLTAEGIRTNATVCFSIAQAIACAEAVARGLQTAAAAGMDTLTLIPNVTIMVGRLDDHLGRVMEAGGRSVEPRAIAWSGVAVFKEAWRLFEERGYRSRLLVAAYRRALHWTELIGPRVVQTMPYKWWREFNASDVTPRRSLDEPVPKDILRALLGAFPDFRAAYTADGLRPEMFEAYGPSVHTLRQFLAGYDQLLELVRDRMRTR
jgi:transaldolase